MKNNNDNNAMSTGKAGNPFGTYTQGVGMLRQNNKLPKELLLQEHELKILDNAKNNRLRG